MWELHGVGCHVIMSRVLTQCTEVYKVLMKSSCLPPTSFLYRSSYELAVLVQNTFRWAFLSSLFFLPSSLSDALLPSCLLFQSIPEERDNKTWWKLCSIQWCDECTEGETGTRDREKVGVILTPVIGWFVMFLQEKNERLDRPGRHWKGHDLTRSTLTKSTPNKSTSHWVNFH